MKSSVIFLIKLISRPWQSDELCLHSVKQILFWWGLSIGASTFFQSFIQMLTGSHAIWLPGYGFVFFVFLGAVVANILHRWAVFYVEESVALAIINHTLFVAFVFFTMYALRITSEAQYF